MNRFALALLAAVCFGAILSLLFRKDSDSTTKVENRIRSTTFEQPKPLHEQTEKKEVEIKKTNRRLEDTPFFERVVIPAKEAVSSWLAKFAPSSILDYVSLKLLMSGQRGDTKHVEGFLFQVVAMAIIAGGFTAWAVHADSTIVFVRKIAFTVLGTLMGAGLPISRLTRKIRERQEAMRMQLPEVLDLLCVSVEAGLSFDAALRRIVVRMKGPFIDECKKMLNDTKMGMTKREALIDMSTRCGVQDIALFTTSVIQAERLGSNMSGTLKAQADNVRDRHRQYIRALAMKAPVKIVVPLVLFILPSIFIIALAPPVFSIVKTMMEK